MIFLTSACTDVGIRKKTNQDSHLIKVAKTPIGNVALAVMCDGMGGLAKGEVASSHVIELFNKWFCTQLPAIIKSNTFGNLKYQWNSIVQIANATIAEYGNEFGVSMGTTLTAVLLINNKGYAIHVGDSRLYRITTNSIEILTEDQTLVAREVRNGRLTPEQAKTDPRRSVLLQCIGASRVVEPQFLEFDVSSNTVLMLCSDGFRHQISEQEIQMEFSPSDLLSKEIMLQRSKNLIELNKSRKETDNITTLLVKIIGE